MKIRGSVVSLSFFFFPHPPEDAKKTYKYNYSPPPKKRIFFYKSHGKGIHAKKKKTDLPKKNDFPTIGG